MRNFLLAIHRILFWSNRFIFLCRGRKNKIDSSPRSSRFNHPSVGHFDVDFIDWIVILFIFSFKVWLCLGISLAVMAPVLTFLSNLYGRYMERSSNPNPSRAHIRRPIFDFYSLLHNFSFLLSHITNQGNSIHWYSVEHKWIIILLQVIVTICAWDPAAVTF